VRLVDGQITVNSPYIANPTLTNNGKELNSRRYTGENPVHQTRCEPLSAHDDPTRFREVEALNWTQSDNRCGLTLALIGSPHGETEPRKAT
jgi:hypothetical protein